MASADMNALAAKYGATVAMDPQALAAKYGATVKVGPTDTQKQQLAKNDQMIADRQQAPDAGFWNTIGDALKNGPKSFMDFISSHPMQQLSEHGKEMGSAAKAAFHRGDYSTAVGIGLASLLPGVGDEAVASGNAIGEGKPKEGLAHAALAVAPVVAPEAASKAIEVAPDIVSAAGDAAKGAVQGTADVVRGAANSPGVAKLASGAIQTVGAPVALATGHPVIAGGLAVRGVSNIGKGLAERAAASAESEAPTGAGYAQTAGTVQDPNFVPPSNVGVPVTPVNPELDAIAKSSGFGSYAEAPPEFQAGFRNMAEANAQLAARRAALQSQAPQSVQAPPQAPAVPQGPPKTIADLIRDELAAKRAAQEESTPQPLTGGNKPQPIVTRGTPLRPPMQSPASVAEAVSPQATQPEPTQPASTEQAPMNLQAETTVPKRSLAQTESAMAQKGAAQTEQPQSRFTATGEPKSTALRATEIENSNRSNLAKQYAEVLHDMVQNGHPELDPSKIEAGRWSDAQLAQGATPRWSNLANVFGKKNAPSVATVAEIVKEYRKLAAAAKKTVPTTASEVLSKNPKAASAAQALKDAMEQENQ